MPPDNTRLDAAESAFFYRDLEAIEAELHNIDFPEIKYARVLPVDENFNPGAVTVTYRQFSGVGQAKVISDKSKDLPRVDVLGNEFPGAVKAIGDSFGYSIFEIAAAAQAASKGYPGQSLDRARAAWAYEAIQRKLDYVAALGDADTGLKGIINHSAVTAGTAANGALGTATWITKTPDEILADVVAMVAYVRDGTNSVESPDTLVVPEAQFAHIAMTRLNTANDKTILQFLLQNQPFIKNVEPWFYAKQAGAGSADRAVVYRRDPMKLKLRNPCGFRRLEPQAEGLEYVVPCYLTTAGVILYKPKSVYYLDGI